MTAPTPTPGDFLAPAPLSGVRIGYGWVSTGSRTSPANRRR
ncbi:hypothetical protein [Micromonospora sp. WMMD712]|nr:hypothetical protein [Micromonospora sp. WMMD712]WFE56654.1 hypothetical protein O7633_07070 [Micromonospora sp. WMMD712]